ncbi:MAG TPA: response regulator [Candidatus Xenobia bacterium]|jgi:serine/threonine protein kinase/CheY-like chemotaxis protein
MTLLVVDDSEMNREALSRRLKARGFTVAQASDGQETLTLVSAGGIDLILLDIHMPGISGIEVLRTLRERWSMADLPIMMLSAKDDSEVMVEAFRLGANDYVTKPIDFEVTLARIQALLARKTLEGRAPVDAGSTATKTSCAPLPTDESDISPGTHLGQYRLMGVLGRGGMGVVYEAEDVDLQRRAAVKVMHRRFSVDAQWASRFRREAQTVARIDHANVVGIYHIGTWQDQLYIAMPLVKGMSASQLVHQRGALPWREATHLVVQACRGLAAAHDIQVLHRDFKPDNMMVGPDGTVKLLDFGLATSSVGPVDERLTLPGTLMGSPHFMSPEQCRGAETDPRSDLYQVGASYFQLLTGKTPFHQYKYSLDLLNAHVQEPVPDPRTLQPDLPEACKTIIDKAMAKDPDDRYVTVEALMLDLEKLLTEVR